MGTTATGLAVVNAGGSDHWAVFNVGDSRVYRHLDGRLRLVTVDHSEVQELVDAGLITEAEAGRHPLRNVVTRSLGSEPAPVVDVWVFPPHPGERFVICSDGLSGELTLARIEPRSSTSTTTRRRAPRRSSRRPSTRAGGTTCPPSSSPSTPATRTTTTSTRHRGRPGRVRGAPCDTQGRAARPPRLECAVPR